MESESRYALVGAFALTMLVAGALFTLWLGKVSFDQEYVQYEVEFKGPVRGLSKSAEVRFNGIKVGEVTNLGLDKMDPDNLVIAQIKVFKETPVKADSYAQLEPQGITGLSYIQIYGGSHNSPPLTKKPGLALPRIPSHQAQLEGILSQGEDMILAGNEVLARINKILDEKTITNISTIIDDVRTLTDRLAAEETLFSDVHQAVRSANEAAIAVQALAQSGQKLVDGDGGKLVTDLDAAVVQIKAASTKANALIDRISDPLGRFSEDGLNELTLALSDLRALTQALQRVVEEVDRNPGEFITGEPIKEVEVPR